ncbi:hypothetical protein OY671_006784 [Metschnikowia pulcherrima]|nr:hypothetical protein OY671_006784 [Metschnikowia pulcherrima]
MNLMIFGTTGLCGAGFLASAEKSDQFSTITSVTRRPVHTNHSKVKKFVEDDVNRYLEIISEEKPSVLFSALATTHKAAGTARAFVKTDYGINLKIAKAAKAAGVDTFVLVSSILASPSSHVRDILALKFPRTIFLRPGPLVGKRDRSMGLHNDVSATVFGHFQGSFLGNNLFFATTGSDVGTAAVRSILASRSNTTSPIVEIVNCKRILQLASGKR